MSFLLIASLILPLCFLVRQMARKGAFDEVLSLWHHAPLIARIVAVLSFLCAFTYGSDKQAGAGINRIMSRMGRSIAGAALRCFSPTEQATGYAVCAIGTDEVHDLSLSPNGVLVESIARRGAHDDGFWHSDSFTNQLWHAGLVDERKIWIHTDGTITFKAPSFGIAPSELSAISAASNCTVYAPRYGSYGFLPTFHWDNIVTSRLWTAVSDRHTRMITWEGALEERLTNHIFSFQVEFFDGGDILYRYSPSVGTNCEVGLFRNGALQLIDLPMNTTSVLLSYIGDLTDGTGDSDNDGLSDWEEVMVTGTNPHPPRPTSGAIDEREIPQWFDLFPQDCDGDGILDYSETGGVSQCSKFLWYDTSNGENLLQGEVGDVNNRIVHGELYYSVQMDGESHQYFSLDVNGLVYLPFSTNQLGVTTSYDRNRDLAEWENNKGHIAIAAFWSDLRSRVNANTKILLANDVKNSQTIVEYQNISCNYAETNEVASFQVILPHNRPNTFYVSYRNCTEKFQELYPTLGVQNSRIHNPKQPNSRYNITYSYGVQNAFPTNTTLIYHLGHWTNPDDADTDQDGLTDFEEITQHKTNPLSTDTDNDGIVDPQEIEYKTNPLKADSDFDDLPDKWELENGLNPRSAYGENGLNGDPDNDGLNNVKELSLGTNPKLSDTDRDGLDDKKEAGWIELGRNLIPFDCSGGTTLSNSSNYDSHCFKVPLPFPIRIGGVLSTNIVVAVNGIVGLLDAQNASEGFIATDLNSDFRTSSHNRVHTTIAAYWDDLYASPANLSRISTADVVKDNKRYFVVEYKDIRPYLGRAIPNNIGTFQVVIPEAETNTIFVQYVTLSGTMNCGSATLGAQVANRRVNLPFSYNQNYSITEGSVITYHLGTGGSPLLFDTDSDGLNDGIEATIQTSSSREDSDGDGLSDLWEYNCGTSPISAYGDDGEFGDPDGDKLLNKEECRNGTDPFNQDTDGDGLADPDEDGLTNQEECMWNTNPYAEDSDGDGVADGEEISQYSDPDDLTDEGRPGSRAPISFTFGDPSGSHSEKYRLVIKPLSPSWRTVYSDEMPKTVEWVNANYGECETKLALLARGFDYEVRLYHAGTNESDNPDYDYRFIISPSPYVGIMIDDPDELQQESDGTSHYFSGEGKVIRLRVLDASIVADYNRDGQIDEIDLAQTYKGRVFRHWINGDNDNGDFSMGNQDMPRQGGSYNPITWANCEDGDMNGRCDLLDFAPIHLNIGNMLMHLEDELHHYQFTLSQQDEAVSVVWTTLEANRANAFLKEDFTTFGENLNGVSFWAHVTSIESDKGTELPNSFLQLIQNDPRFGIIMVEGVEESTTPLIFKCYRKSGENSSDANLVFQLELPMKISNVEDMFRFHNIRFSPSLANRNGEPRNLPDDECDNIDIFLTHGFLVAENESRAWGSEFFKRLWQEGSRARFHNVTWSSNTGSSVSYEENVNNAFLSSASYASLVNSIKQTNQSRIVVMAHSLGNMLTSSAIEDHGLDADAYFALNAAVPTEAYDATMANITTNAANPLLHSDWYGYKPNTWASNFCSLYLDEDVFPNDDRAKLTWRGRFASVPQIMYNFWSSGDEVLEIKDTSQAALYVTDGIEVDWRWNIMPISVNARRYVWQKQALFKGRSFVYGTTWAGWEFEANISPENANRLSDFALRIYPIFQHSPNMMFSSTIPEENRNSILARGIPELSYPLGYTNLVKNVFRGDFDMNDRFMRRLDEVWPQRDIDFNDAGNTRPNRWLHTDLLNVAHYFTFKLFSKIVELGELK